ncbi:MAG: tyrosine-protein phosphatase [Chloroflexi bacterium]|nr:tyrosine-protein phosphatase [Chloroflexota bacterium]
MSTIESLHQRRLALEGTYNVRDLGGYATRDGRHIRWHTLLRADKLDRIAPEAQQQLLDHGLHTIIDLRFSDEVAAEPNVFAQSSAVSYLHFPLYELIGVGTLPAVPDNLEELYQLILDHRKEQIRLILHTLAAPGTLPALLHCTAGKDRTGLMVALVLGAVDVPHETIIEDYALSAQYLHTLFDELRATALQAGYDTEWYDRLLLCKPETMRTTLAHLDRRYGGVEAYLLQIGLEKAELEGLRTALLE